MGGEVHPAIAARDLAAGCWLGRRVLEAPGAAGGPVFRRFHQGFNLVLLEARVN